MRAGIDIFNYIITKDTINRIKELCTKQIEWYNANKIATPDHIICKVILNIIESSKD